MEIGRVAHTLQVGSTDEEVIDKQLAAVVDGQHLRFVLKIRHRHFMPFRGNGVLRGPLLGQAYAIAQCLGGHDGRQRKQQQAGENNFHTCTRFYDLLNKDVLRIRPNDHPF